MYLACWKWSSKQSFPVQVSIKTNTHTHNSTCFFLSSHSSHFKPIRRAYLSTSQLYGVPYAVYTNTQRHPVNVFSNNNEASKGWSFAGNCCQINGLIFTPNCVWECVYNLMKSCQRAIFHIYRISVTMKCKWARIERLTPSMIIEIEKKRKKEILLHCMIQVG